MRLSRSTRALAVSALTLLTAAPIASAHGIQGRADLPVPIVAFYWASSIILVVSFVGLALGWKRPLIADALARAHRRVPLGGFARVVTGVLRVLSVFLFLLVAATALVGSSDLNNNLAPIAVYVVWWIGIAVCAATVGDVWRWLHPVATVMRWCRVPEVRPDRRYPLGMWPAFAGLVLFVWFELVYPTAAHVHLLGALIVIWAATAAIGMAWYGTAVWLDNGEPFSAYTKLLSGLAFTTPAADTELAIRPPAIGVRAILPRPGIVPFAGLLIGSVSFDGLSRTLWWKRRLADVTIHLVERGVDAQTAQIAVGTVGLAVMITLAIGAFIGAAAIAQRIGGLRHDTSYGTVAQAFVPSLIPIAFAYVIAHYFSFFWFQSQQVVRLASDPFGAGWNLFGTTNFQVDYSTLSANAIWIIQVAAIVVGHVLGLVLAHDRALEIAQEGRHAVRSQWAMLALMVLYTVGGLYFLSEGLNV